MPEEAKTLGGRYPSSLESLNVFMEGKFNISILVFLGPFLCTEPQKSTQNLLRTFRRHKLASGGSEVLVFLSDMRILGLHANNDFQNTPFDEMMLSSPPPNNDQTPVGVPTL